MLRRNVIRNIRNRPPPPGELKSFVGFNAEPAPKLRPARRQSPHENGHGVTLSNLDERLLSSLEDAISGHGFDYAHELAAIRAEALRYNEMTPEGATNG